MAAGECLRRAGYQVSGGWTVGEIEQVIENVGERIL